MYPFLFLLGIYFGFRIAYTQSFFFFFWDWTLKKKKKKKRFDVFNGMFKTFYWKRKPFSFHLIKWSFFKRLPVKARIMCKILLLLLRHYFCKNYFTCINQNVILDLAQSYFLFNLHHLLNPMVIVLLKYQLLNIETSFLTTSRSIKNAKTLVQFKSSLKIHLFNASYM